MNNKPPSPVPRFVLKSPGVLRVKHTPPPGTPTSSSSPSTPTSAPVSPLVSKRAHINDESKDGDEHREHKELLRSSTFNLSEISDDDASHITKYHEEEEEKIRQQETRIKHLEDELSHSNDIKIQQQRTIEQLQTDLKQAQQSILVQDESTKLMTQKVDSFQSKVSELEIDKTKLLQDLEKLRNSVVALESAREKSHTQSKSTNSDTGVKFSNSNSSDSNNTTPRDYTNENTQLISPTNTNTSQNAVPKPELLQNHSNADQTRTTDTPTHVPIHRNYTPPRPLSSAFHNHSSDRGVNSPDKLNGSVNNSTYNQSYGNYASYSSRKTPPPPSISQSKNTLQDLQNLLIDMTKTAMEQKSNVEVLLRNIDITLTTSTSPYSSTNERPMTPEETIFFRGEKKTLERELSLLEGVISELKDQKVRCDQKLDRVRQRIEENEAKQGMPVPYAAGSPSFLETRELLGGSSPTRAFNQSPTHTLSQSPIHAFSQSPTHAFSQSPTHASDQSGRVGTSPTRNISPYFYYGNKDKVDLPPPPDMYSPSLHRLTSDHIHKFSPQFVPDAEKLKPTTRDYSYLIHHPPEKDSKLEKAPSDEQKAPSFEWNYYFSSRS